MGLSYRGKLEFIEMLNKCNSKEGWLRRLRQVPIFKRIIEGGEEKGLSHVD